MAARVRRLRRGRLVVTQLEEQGVEVRRVNAGEHAEAVGLFMEEVVEQTLRHLGWSELADAVRGAKLRSMDDAYLSSRRHASVDISPLVVASLEVWAERGMPEDDWDKATSHRREGAGSGSTTARAERWAAVGRLAHNQLI